LITFIIGGANSGKSSFALKLAESIEGKGAFIATAQAFDEEMSEKIKRHKEQRSNQWQTYEEPLEIANLIKQIEGRYEKIIIDCLTLWLSNIIYHCHPIEQSIEDLVSQLKRIKKPCFVVSNEVGLGIVPENQLARKFRNYSGLMNKKVAVISDWVYFIYAGIPIKIK